MQPSDFYCQMLVDLHNEIDWLERRIFEALQKHPQGLTRQQLVALVYRQTSQRFTDNNDTKDRKLRKAIQSLRNKGVPIISNSGRAGYRLDASEASKAAMLADLTSRRDRLNETIRQVVKFRTIPEKLAANPFQEKLF